MSYNHVNGHYPNNLIGVCQNQGDFNHNTSFSHNGRYHSRHSGHITPNNSTRWRQGRQPYYNTDHQKGTGRTFANYYQGQSQRYRDNRHQIMNNNSSFGRNFRTEETYFRRENFGNSSEFWKARPAFNREDPFRNHRQDSRRHSNFQKVQNQYSSYQNQIPEGRQNNRSDTRSEKQKYINQPQDIPTIGTLNCDCTVGVRIGSSVIRALVDTGAAISLISHDQLVKTGLSKKIDLEPSNIPNIAGVGGTIIRILGQVTLPTEIGKLTLQQRFYVLDHMTKPLILGMDFLTEQEADIDLSAAPTLRVQKGMIEVPISTGGAFTKSQFVRLVSDVTIPARTEVIVPVHTKTDNGSIGIIENHACLPSTSNVIGAKCLVEVTHNRSVYRLLNPTNASIDLKKQQIVGKFMKLEEHEILDTLDDTVEAPSVNHLSRDTTDDEQYIARAKELGIDLSNADLTESQKRELLILLGQHRDVFAKDMTELGMCTEGGYTHKIETGDAPPIRQRYYRASPQHKEYIAKKIEEMLETDVIEPSTTSWLSPVILVKKKGGELRFCLDYRALNKVTKPIHFPLPRLDEVFDTIAESHAKIFSTLDLLSGYFQIPLDPETKHKTGFISHKGVFQFKRLPFGLTNGPASFQMVMTQVLRDMNWQFALVYVDDVLIFSRNFEEHLQHLRAVFQKLKEANLRLKPSKCHFAAHQVHYLGHILSKDGIKVNPDKTEAVQSFPRPRNTKEVRAFLGLCNYYRKFVKNFSHRAAPLNQLLRKDVKFKWTDQCEAAFADLKDALISPPVLAFPDFNKDFILYTDASDRAIGYILGQRDEEGKEAVIAYGGRALYGHEINWDITDKECLALIEGVKQYNVYLAGSRFTVYTDNIAVSYIDQMKCKTGRLKRWSMFLQQYQYSIHYKPGRKHWNADALSRRPYTETTSEQPTTNSSLEPDPKIQSTQKDIPAPPNHTAHVSTISKMTEAENEYMDLHPFEAVQEVMTVSVEDIREAQLQDPILAGYIKYLETGEYPEDKKLAGHIRDEHMCFLMDNGVLYHLFSPRGKGSKASRQVTQLCIPKNMRDDILRSYHDSLGHQGQDRTQRAISLKYFWPRMQADIEEYVKSCETCQRSKPYYHRKQAPLRPLPTGEVFSRVHMDIIGPLTKTPDGYNHILLVVCAFTKWCEAFPLKSTSAQTVAQTFYSEIICRYGAPRELLTDQAQNFSSKVIAELCRTFQITKLRTSSYHPQTNAACERMNSFIEQTLKSYIKEDQSNWPQVLPSVLQAYRMTPATESTGFSPFYLMFLREPTLPIDTELLPPPNVSNDVRQYVKDLRENAERTRKIAHDNIELAKQKYTYQHDKKAAEPTFKVGDAVWLFCSRTQPGLSPKLCKKWTGPYYICIEYGNYTYKLRRASDHKLIRSVVHANRLKPHRDSDDRPTNCPTEPPLGVPDEELNPEEIGGEVRSDKQETQRRHTNDQRNTDSTEDSNKEESTQDKITTDQLKDDNENNQEQVRAPRPEDISCILLCRVTNGKRQYRVRLRNGSPTWFNEDQLPKQMVREFHATKTYDGRARKRNKNKH